MIDTDAFISRISELLKEVGSYQMDHFRSAGPGGGDRKNSREYVSEIDIESERRLHEGLTNLLPGSRFYGEETVQESGEGYTWVVDPLDGTTNYLSGHDHWTISAALVSRQPENNQNSVKAASRIHEASSKIVLGAVYRPFTSELFTAVKGSGAYFNGNQLPKQQNMPLSECLLGTGFPYRSKDTVRAFFPCAEEMLYACRGLRRCGSAALDISYVGAGFLQGFWEADLQPYDVAAGILIAEESGCSVTDFFGRPYALFASGTIAVGVPGAQEEMQRITAAHYAGIDRLH